MPFVFRSVPEIPDVKIITPPRSDDARGWFAEMYKRSEFAAHGITATFVQDDHSRSSTRGVLRGLHYQVDPAAQGKLVRCATGEIFDVAVDLRKSSPTFARSVTIRLSAREPRMVWIPPGFAHGFLTLSEGADVIYKHTHEYSPQHARRIRWDDPVLAIAWPLPGTPLLSERDARAPLLSEVAP